MEEEIEILRKNLYLALKVRFSEYGIQSSQSEAKGVYVTKRIKEQKDIDQRYEGYQWLFSGKSLGNYCRSLYSLTTGILEKVKSLIKESKYEIAQVRDLVTKPFIIELKTLIGQEENHKSRLEESSILFNTAGLIDSVPIDSILIDSINRLYDFRRKVLNELLKELTHLNDYGRFGIILYKEFEIEDTPIVPPGTIGFCWNKNRNFIEDLVKFHTFLRDLNFIEKDTSINLLKTGFGCTYIKEPLNIKWTKLVKGKSSKALLFHFIDELEHLNYINITEQNSILFKKIEFVFCNYDGKRFQNLDISKSQWLNQRKSLRTPQEFQLDNIMYSIS